MKHILFALVALLPLSATAAPAKVDIEAMKRQIEANQPQARSAAPVPLTAEQKETVKRVEEYLSGLTTIMADFMQTSPQGDISTGKFYLQRPGKMRWQYNPPTPILMVARGNTLTFYDYELKQESNIPLDDTLAGFIARDRISFTDAVMITEFENAGEAIRITLVQTKRPKDGALTLEFSDHPLQIRNMIVTDATNQVTNVALSNAKFGIGLDKRLFIFEAPKGKRR